LRYAFDTISIPESAKICADALSTDSEVGLRYGNLLPVKCPRDDVVTTTTVMYTVFKSFFKFGEQDMPPSEEDYEFGRTIYGLTEKLVAEVRPIHPVPCSDITTPRDTTKKSVLGR
jgi:hypothetical protein